MPISYTIDEAGKRIFTRCEGVVTYAELRAHMNAEIDITAASYCEIFDCADAVTNITPLDIRELVGERKKVARLRPPAPVAVVTANDKFFALFRMFDMLTEDIRPMRVFRTRDEAEAWLEVISGSQNNI